MPPLWIPKPQVLPLFHSLRLTNLSEFCAAVQLSSAVKESEPEVKDLLEQYSLLRVSRDRLLQGTLG